MCSSLSTVRRREGGAVVARRAGVFLGMGSCQMRAISCGQEWGLLALDKAVRDDVYSRSLGRGGSEENEPAERLEGAEAEAQRSL